jgi:hypothetical protein
MRRTSAAHWRCGEGGRRAVMVPMQSVLSPDADVASPDADVACPDADVWPVRAMVRAESRKWLPAAANTRTDRDRLTQLCSRPSIGRGDTERWLCAATSTSERSASTCALSSFSLPIDSSRIFIAASARRSCSSSDSDSSSCSAMCARCRTCRARARALCVRVACVARELRGVRAEQGPRPRAAPTLPPGPANVRPRATTSLQRVHQRCAAQTCSCRAIHARALSSCVDTHRSRSSRSIASSLRFSSIRA